MREPLNGAGAWRGPDLADDKSWMINLDERALEEIDAALNHVKKAGLQIPFSKDDFPLDHLKSILDGVPEQLEEGLGFALMHGIERDRYSDEDCHLIYWGIGVHLGNPVSQNDRGHRMGHVTDEGRSYDDPSARGYQTAQRMDFHCDLLPVDILSLFCLRPAKSGGTSHLVSTLTVNNIILQERPDLLEVLYGNFNLDWRDEEPEGAQPWYSIPMLSIAGGKVTGRFCSRQYYQSVVRHGEELGLTDIQAEALDFANEVANREDIRMSMQFQAGDIQLVNNHTIMHSRDAFEDFDDPVLKRHLLRMWIGCPVDQRRELDASLAERRALVDTGGIPMKRVAAE
ncbi:MAG: TauD/TfdA family dioxygenase [Rhodospirillales bacterium]|nr:TauD/TfdA family dioxygenase [Rhodospirillales bacterium]